MDFALTSDDLIRQVYNTLNGLANPAITESTVEKVLRRVFQTLQTPAWTFAHTTPEKRVRSLVQDSLHDNISRSSMHGLRHARHTFLITCAFAKLALSQPLAEQMLKFFTSQQWEIESYENSRYMKEWHLGLRALSELSLDQHVFGNSDNNNNTLFDTWSPTSPLLPLMLAPHHYDNPFDTYHHRGRGHGHSHGSPRLLTPPHYPRARSLGHRRSHGLQLALPRLSNSAWSSPVLSPAGRRPGPYFDEVGQLQWQQEEMNWKLDGIDQKLDRLVGW